MPTNNQGSSTAWLFILVLAVVIPPLLVRLMTYLIGFSKEMKKLNTEIRRGIGDERKYWIRERRRLWLSLIPFVKY